MSKDLFGEESGNDIDKLYIGMPEYNNVKQQDPVITATIKFRNENDYLKFKELLRIHMYNGVKPFDGMQKKDKKQAWFPHKEKASKYVYIDGDSDAT